MIDAMIDSSVMITVTLSAFFSLNVFSQQLQSIVRNQLERASGGKGILNYSGDNDNDKDPVRMMEMPEFGLPKAFKRQYSMGSTARG